MIQQGRETRVPSPVAERGSPGQTLDPGGKVPVGEDVREAEVREVHLGELGEEDLLAEMGKDYHDLGSWHPRSPLVILIFYVI